MFRTIQNHQRSKKMGWRKFNESLDKALPQKGDSAGDIIGKAVTSWIAAPMALLDLLEPEPSSGGRGGGQQSGGDGHYHCYPCKDSDCAKR
jgi:hypothetical protein